MKRWGTKGKARHSSPCSLERSKQSNYFRLNWKGLSPALPQGLGVCGDPAMLRTAGGHSLPPQPGCHPQTWPGLLPGTAARPRGRPRSGAQETAHGASGPAQSKPTVCGSEPRSPQRFNTDSLNICQKLHLASPKAGTDAPQVPNLLNIYIHAHMGTYIYMSI